MIFILVICAVSSISKSDKVDPKIHESLNKENKIRVVVKLKEPSIEKGIIFKTQKTDSEIELEKKEIKKKIIDTVGKEKIRHIFTDEIAIEVSKDDLDELNKNPDVHSVVIDKPIHAFLQDSVPLINASTIWPIQISEINITGIDETVCVIDTGINFSHPDLIGKNKTCIIDCASKTCVENCSIGDDNGHGTHVAGIVAASGGINGVTIGANLIGVKVLDSSGSGTGTDLNAGIDWCISNVATHNISVITMSLGTEAPDLYDSYCDSSFTTTTFRINNATSHNISIVAATGNDGNITHIASPACIRNVTAIGSIKKDDATIDYNRNNLTDLIAPGYLINSTRWAGGSCLAGCSCSGNYMICSGTSMATPHVAGAFALVRQFFRLQNGRVPTPNEIKIILNNTGKQINDTAGTGLNYSRIDVYTALISIDSSNPTVNLISPADNSTQFSKNLSFKCSANDVELSNLTLYIWNSTSLYNTSTKSVNGINTREEFNLTDMTYGNYEWNCLAYDTKGNYSFASLNYTFTIKNISVSLNSPPNNIQTNQAEQTFNCSSETETSKELTNITLFVWNSSSLIFNSTQNISGTTNVTNFTYNLTVETDYLWNCETNNNASESFFAQNNYTITYDITPPSISNVSSSPTTTSSATISWTTNENTNSSVNYGITSSLGTLLNSSNFTTTHSFSLSGLSSSTPHDYNVSNCDLAGNCNTSGGHNFTTSAEQVIVSSSGGGGGGGSALKTYTPTNEQSSTGYTKELKKNEKIKFTFFDEKAEKHTLTVNSVGKDFVELTIQSDPIKLTLGIGQSAKLNLTSSDYYDLYVKLEEIIGTKAKITIQTIQEEIPKPTPITGKTVEEGEDEVEKEGIEKKIEFLDMEIKKLKTIIYISIPIFIIAIIFLLLRKRRRKNKK